MSVIDAIAYEDGDLFVRFMSGRVYVYHDVPRCEFQQFDSAVSKGQFFNQHIKGWYACREVSGAATQQKKESTR